MDKFTKKYAFVCFNVKYDDKAGLGNLPDVLNDKKTVRRTLNLMAISEENIFELTDVSHSEIEEAS